MTRKRRIYTPVAPPTKRDVLAEAVRYAREQRQAQRRGYRVYLAWQVENDARWERIIDLSHIFTYPKCMFNVAMIHVMAGCRPHYWRWMRQYYQV